MSKSILAIDTPECCCQCRFSGADGDYCCLKENMISDSNSISEEEYLNKKPDWCSLRDLPEKKEEKQYFTRKDNRGNTETYGETRDMITVGWNMCIEEILKGANGNE